MYVKWEWNLKECVIFETFLHSLSHLFFWNINLLPYEKKKIKNSSLWFPTYAHIILLNITLKLCLFGFPLRSNFLQRILHLYMRSSGCVQCLFSMVSVLCFRHWFLFFSPNRSDHQHTCIYIPNVTFIPNHWQRVCCYIDKNVSCYRKKET